MSHTTKTLVPVVCQEEECNKQLLLQQTLMLKIEQLYKQYKTKQVNATEIDEQCQKLMSDLIESLSKLQNNDYFLYSFVNNQIIKSGCLYNFKMLLKSKIKYGLRKNALKMLINLLNRTHRVESSMYEEQFNPNVEGQDLYKRYFSSLLYELGEILKDAQIIAEDLNYCMIVSDLILYLFDIVPFDTLVITVYAHEAIKFSLKYKDHLRHKFLMILKKAILKLNNDLFAQNINIMVNEGRFAEFLILIKNTLMYTFKSYDASTSECVDVLTEQDIFYMLQMFISSLPNFHTPLDRELNTEIVKIHFELYDFLIDFLSLNLIDRSIEEVSTKTLSSMKDVIQEFVTSEFKEPNQTWTYEMKVLRLMIELNKKLIITKYHLNIDQCSSLIYDTVADLIDHKKIDVDYFMENAWPFLHSKWTHDLMRNYKIGPLQIVDAICNMAKIGHVKYIEYFKAHVEQLLTKHEGEMHWAIQHTLMKLITAYSNLGLPSAHIKPVLDLYRQKCQHFSVDAWINSTFSFYSNLLGEDQQFNTCYLDDVDMWTPHLMSILDRIKQINVIGKIGAKCEYRLWMGQPILEGFFNYSHKNRNKLDAVLFGDETNIFELIRFLEFLKDTDTFGGGKSLEKLMDKLYQRCDQLNRMR